MRFCPLAWILENSRTVFGSNFRDQRPWRQRAPQATKLRYHISTPEK